MDILSEYPQDHLRTLVNTKLSKEERADKYTSLIARHTSTILCNHPASTINMQKGK
jgi:hypothetical protein